MVTQEFRDRSDDRIEIPYSAHWTITLNIPLDDLYQLKCDIAALKLGVKISRKYKIPFNEVKRKKKNIINPSQVRVISYHFKIQQLGFLLNVTNSFPILPGIHWQISWLGKRRYKQYYSHIWNLTCCKNESGNVGLENPADYVYAWLHFS